MNITVKKWDGKGLLPETFDEHYVDVSGMTYNHFIRYEVVQSYNIIDTRTTFYSGQLYVPDEWSEEELRNYIYERHTKFTNAQYLDTKIIVLSLHPLQSAMTSDEHPNGIRMEASTKLTEAVNDDEDEFDRKMRELILELEGTCCEY